MKKGVEEGAAGGTYALRNENFVLFFDDQKRNLFLSPTVECDHGSYISSVSWVPPSMQCCPQVFFEMNIFFETGEAIQDKILHKLFLTLNLKHTHTHTNVL